MRARRNGSSTMHAAITMVVMTMMKTKPRMKRMRETNRDMPALSLAMVTLASNRALLLVGEPGTAKSLLSELLAASICGSSLLTIQGSAATTEDQIKYGWNYALLLAEGPSPRALVPSALYRAMLGGHIVRFEEITRCPPEVQDGLLSKKADTRQPVPALQDTDIDALLASDDGIFKFNFLP